jgi:hypothetical protein
LLCAWVPNRTLGLFWFFAWVPNRTLGLLWKGEGNRWRAEKEEKLVTFFSSLELLRKVLRAKCNNAGLQARADYVRPSQVPTSYW